MTFDLGRVAALTMTGVLLLVFAGELWALSRVSFWRIGGHDYGLYMDATRRWLTGGGFYPIWQVSGPYTIDAWPILYPPQALLLFVPFAFLPAVLWFAVPTTLTVGVIVGYRPAPWALAAIAFILAAFPAEVVLPYLSGTPTIWAVAALAVATRRPAWGALILVKPTLLPFALIGIHDRLWWAVALVLGLVGLLFLPMTLEWVRSVVNLTGPKSGLLYSMENLPLCAIPLVAWLGRRRAGPSRGT